MRESYDISLQLDWKGLPDESALIENLIEGGTLGKFLYTVANDIIEGRYNLEAGHTRIILNQLIETVATIQGTLGSMDLNVQSIAGVINEHTDLLKNLEPREQTLFKMPREIAVTDRNLDEDKPADNISIAPLELKYDTPAATEALDIYSEDDNEEGIQLLTDMDDIFDIEMGS